MQKYRIIGFDFDGTLLDIEDYIWNPLHKAFKVPKEYVIAHYNSYKNGKITYEQWFDSDIKEWARRGIGKCELEKEIRNMSLVVGVEDTLRELKSRHYTLALISGSIDTALHTLLPNDPFDHLMINRLWFDSANQIYNWQHTPYDDQHKLTGLKAICWAEDAELEECVFVGDNVNDITVLKGAGLGIAFNPKSKLVEEAAKVVIKEKDLSKILDYL